MSVHNPSRVVAGHCPKCESVVVILNDHEVWDLATCPCGWADGTTALVNHVRLERGLLIVEDG